MIDQVLPLRLHGERHLFRVQEQAHTSEGVTRVSLKGEPEVLRRLEGYTFIPHGSNELLTIAALRLVPPPDSDKASFALAEARPASILAAQTFTAPGDDHYSTSV